MCVIALSPKGNDLPTEEQIRQMFKRNDDGAGYAWDDGKKVHWRKGFMNVDDLLEDLGPLENWKDYIVAIHFRIGTAGNNDQQTTHPFPLSSSFGDLRKLQGEGPVLFHNGVLTGYGGVIDPLASDTQDFVSGVASKLLAKPNKPSKITEKTISNLIGSSRILILYGKGKYLKFGNWTEKDGNFYSNMIWEPKTYTYPSSSYYGYSEDEPYTYEYAWPSTYHQWLIVTPERGKLILGAAEKQKNGKYTFKCTEDLEWETNEDCTEWWTTTKGKQLKLNYEEQADDDAYADAFETDYKYFNEAKELEDWLGDKVEYNDHTVEVEGKIWYIDDYTLEVFTRKIAETLTDCDVDVALEVLKETGHLPVDDIELENMAKECGLDLDAIEEEILKKEALLYANNAE